jgi:hypothetical protein
MRSMRGGDGTFLGSCQIDTDALARVASHSRRPRRTGRAAQPLEIAGQTVRDAADRIDFVQRTHDHRRAQGLSRTI